MFVVPVDRTDDNHDDHSPVLKWVLGLIVVLALCTLAGGVWLVREVLAVHPVVLATDPWEFLFGSANDGALVALAAPLLVTGVIWAFLAFVATKTVQSWESSLVRSGRKAQEEFTRTLEETERKLGLATTASEFWKGQVKDANEKVRVVEAARAELAGRMDRLAAREQTLAREQDKLSRSKDRLEKHVEARTIELERLQRRYVSILNCAGEGICSCDLEGRITFANPAAVSMMGWPGKELIGQEESVVFADRAASKRPQEKEEEEERSHNASHISPVVFQRKDGSRFPVEVVRTPVEEGGRQVGTVLIFKDVTERTEADERFAAKAAELARSNSELEQFAFVASHDLQEPLRKIQAFGDRLKTRVADDLTPEASDYLSRMQSAAARMQGLIDGLLMYSRVLTRARPFARVNLGKVVREVIEDLEVRIEKSGGQVEVAELPCIEGDALQIRQLVQNLIGNALKFQPAGNKPRVSVSARIISGPRRLEESSGNTDLLTKGEICELTVSDNGIGFDEAYLKRLFVVFQRLHSRSEYEGTGIGLAVCRKIVTRHGGSITARSKLGQGATFVVLLPVHQQADSGGGA